MHRRINQKLSDNIHDNTDDPLPSQKSSPGSSSISSRQNKLTPGHNNQAQLHVSPRPRLAAVWNPNWQSDENESSQTAVQIGEESATNTNKYNDLPDELENDEKISEQPHRQRIRSILKNGSSANVPKNKRSKVSNGRHQKYSNSKSKDLQHYNIDDNKSLNGSESSLCLNELPNAVTDVETYRRYLTRSPAIEADGTKAEIKAKTQMVATRRTMALAQAIMSLTLLAISASQLRFVIEYESAQAFPTLNYFLLAICIITEIVCGVGYLIMARFQFREEVMDKIESYLMIPLFMVAIAIIIISSFSLENHVCSEQLNPNPDLKEHNQAPEQSSS